MRRVPAPAPAAAPPYAVRSATPADAEAIWPLLLDLHAHEGVPRPGPAIEAALRRLLADARLGQVFVAALPSGGDVVAYAVVVYGYSLEFAGVDAFLDEVNVRDDLRGRGLGSLLLDAAEAHCRARGVVALHLEVGLSNGRAEELYRRKGYAPHDRRLMTKRLA